MYKVGIIVYVVLLNDQSLYVGDCNLKLVSEDDELQSLKLSKIECDQAVIITIRKDSK